MAAITGFKAYDYRGRIPGELNPDVAYRIGRAYAEFLKPKRVVVGRDIRQSSNELCAALTRGLIDSGVDVYDIGLCGTEVVYFSTFNEGMDGGIMVTASHNPPDYNGMKFVRAQSRPISGDTGLKDIQRIAEADAYSRAAQPGRRHELDVRGKYIEHLLSYLDRAKLKKLKIVVNAGNGGAGLIVDQLESHLPFEFIKINHAPDGSFPNGRAESDAGSESRRDDRGDQEASRRLRCCLGRRLRSLLSVRRERRVHRGLLHRRAARVDVPEARARRAHRARSALDVGNARHGRVARRQGGDVEVGPRFHEGRDARRLMRSTAAR
jgi:hypothetical protein